MLNGKRGHQTRQAFTEEEMKELAVLALEYTNTELGEKLKKSDSTIRKYLRQMGMQGANYCRQCQQNRPGADFIGKTNHTMCKRHKQISPKRQDTQVDGEKLLWAWVADVQSLVTKWNATPEGAPNGPYREYT